MLKIKRLWKELFKFRQKEFDLKWFFLSFYWSQGGRWELGITVDTNGSTLISINFILLSIELDFYQDA